MDRAIERDFLGGVFSPEQSFVHAFSKVRVEPHRCRKFISLFSQRFTCLRAFTSEKNLALPNADVVISVHR